MSPFKLYMQAITQKYADLNGRASREECWSFYLVHFSIVGLSLLLIVLLRQAEVLPSSSLLALAALPSLYNLATLIPMVCVTVRRLHDTNRSGVAVLLVILPAFGALLILGLTLLPGDAGANRYGPDPKASGPAIPVGF